MIRREFHTEGSCGESRLFEGAWDAAVSSGGVEVYLKYDRARETYLFAVAVGRRQVNVCEVGAAASTPRSERLGKAALADAARAALSFTLHELEEDPEQPGMLSGMGAGELEGCLEFDGDGRLAVGEPRRS